MLGRYCEMEAVHGAFDRTGADLCRCVVAHCAHVLCAISVQIILIVQLLKMISVQ